MWAAFNDIAQRLITGNKIEQRKNLQVQLNKLNLSPNSKVLDFGCGTALFTPTIQKMGFKYFGYDIDERLLNYAAKIYKKASFTTQWEKLKENGPYDLILANCCFHHIPDDILIEELKKMRNLLAHGGKFLLIDLLLDNEDTHPLRVLFRKLEQGAFVRKADDYVQLVKTSFDIKDKELWRSHILSIPNPIYNDIIVLRCENPTIS